MDPYNVRKVGTMAGASVNYVRPERPFNRALEILTRSFEDLRSKHLRLYVCGPTGSGKSRIAYELFVELEKHKLAHKLDNVVFATCFLTKDDSNLEVKSVAHLVQHLVHRCAITAPSGDRMDRADVDINITLSDVVRELTGWERGKRTALVLHIDEFQNQPKLVKDFMSAIAAVNGNYNDYFVLPVCTGFPTSEFARVEHLKDATDPTSGSNAVYLGYLTTEDKTADNDQTWSIVRNTALMVLGQGVLPKDLNQVPRVLRYLVEDLSGWPMGATQLGGALANVMLDTSVTSVNSLTAEDFEACEQKMHDALGGIYAESVTGFARALTPPGAFKVTSLICGPFPVCTLGYGPGLWGVKVLGIKYGILTLSAREGKRHT